MNKYLLDLDSIIASVYDLKLACMNAAFTTVQALFHPTL